MEEKRGEEIEKERKKKITWNIQLFSGRDTGCLWVLRVAFNKLCQVWKIQLTSKFGQGTWHPRGFLGGDCPSGGNYLLQ